MKDYPIIFSAPMVLALLARRKTMTRRLAWRQTIATPEKRRPGASHGADGFSYYPTPWQRVKPGDRLWVRESLKRSNPGASDWQWAANAAPISLPRSSPFVPAMIAWAHHQERESIPSIYMPRWASRLTLVVTATKIERLQDISEADARAEGVQHRWLKSAACAPRSLFFVPAEGDKEHSGISAREAFEMLWRVIHGPDAWDENPEVVATTFAVHQKNIDAMRAAAPGGGVKNMGGTTG